MDPDNYGLIHYRRLITSISELEGWLSLEGCFSKFMTLIHNIIQTFIFNYVKALYGILFFLKHTLHLLKQTGHFHSNHLSGKKTLLSSLILINCMLYVRWSKVRILKNSDFALMLVRRGLQQSIQIWNSFPMCHLEAKE